MTYEEARNHFKDQLDIFVCGEHYEAMKVAIEALQKQMPQKVMWETDYTWGIANKQPVCPACENGLTRVLFISDATDGGKRVTYCQTCGQAIDWSE